MEAITKEVENAIAAGLYYLAIVTALSLPDVCSALESHDGETNRAMYNVWYDNWMAARYPEITSLDLYSLRCGVLHQGRLGHSRMQYGRVLFTLHALNLDAVRFCRDMIECVSTWYAAKQNDPNVQANLSRLVQFRANGMAHYMVGVPLIG